MSGVITFNVIDLVNKIDGLLHDIKTDYKGKLPDNIIEIERRVRYMKCKQITKDNVKQISIQILSWIPKIKQEIINDIQLRLGALELGIEQITSRQDNKLVIPPFYSEKIPSSNNFQCPQFIQESSVPEQLIDQQPGSVQKKKCMYNMKCYNTSLEHDNMFQHSSKKRNLMCKTCNSVTEHIGEKNEQFIRFICECRTVYRPNKRK
jgi:hypothetical protein